MFKCTSTAAHATPLTPEPRNAKKAVNTKRLLEMMAVGKDNQNTKFIKNMKHKNMHMPSNNERKCKKCK